MTSTSSGSSAYSPRRSIISTIGTEKTTDRPRWRGAGRS
jgi:hypothetical protein